MALVDEFFTPADGDVADVTDDDSHAAEYAAAGRSRSGRTRTRPSRVRKASRSTDESEGRLARMVRELRELEDTIVAKLAEADRVLWELEAKRSHEDGGYASADEFEGRMLAAAPTLRSLREVVPGDARRPRLAEARREGADTRARQNRALTALARGLERIRAIEADVHGAASTARERLHGIETKQVYAECGYPSFEEFLERALGPSPVLASAVALFADEPFDAKEDEAAPASTGDAGTPGEHDAADFFVIPAEPGDDASAVLGADAPEATAPKSAAPHGAPAAAAAAARAGSPKRLVASLVLCALASVAGAGAAIWSDGGFAPESAPPPAAHEGAAPPSAPASSAGAPKSNSSASVKLSADGKKHVAH